MAVSKAENQVEWATANSKSVTSGSTETSDAASIAGTAFSASVQLKADNNGTPASGDTVSFYAAYSNGDPDGTGSDEYDTSGHAELLAVLDTNDEDPAIRTVPILASVKGVKIIATNNAASNAITVSATIYETSA